MNSDWRLRCQKEYLYGATLVHQSYKPGVLFNDHDHCAFCMDKFGLQKDDLKIGYSTEDNYHWICPQCYNDFKEQFKWVLKTK